MKTYKFGVVIDELGNKEKNAILGAAVVGIGKWKEPIGDFITSKKLGACIYFCNDYTGWNDRYSCHINYCDVLYSLKDDWEKIIKEPLMQPFVTKKTEKLKPYYYQGKVVEPPAGYFILPDYIKPSHAHLDKYWDDNRWQITINHGIYSVVNLNARSYARLIKGNEELYNLMEISDIAPLHPELKEPFLPESKDIKPPAGYYLLSADEPLKDGDQRFDKYDKQWLEVDYNRDYQNNTPYRYNEKYKGIGFVAFARKAANNEENQNMITKNLVTDEKFSIKVSSKEEGQAIWDYLVSIGYNNRKEKFYFRNPEMLSTYIWVNHDYGDKETNIFSADNDNYSKYPVYNLNLEQVKEKFEPKTNNKMSIDLSKIAIRVGTSPTLQKIVQDLFFSRGFAWKIGKIYNNTVENYVGPVKKTLCCSGDDKYYKDNGYQIFDAATQIGEIVALFEKPAIKVPEIHGYKAEYIAREGIITLGCAKIGTGFLSNVLGVFQKTTTGNRNIASITLTENNKTLTIAQIRELLEYVNAVNAENERK